MNTVRHYFLYGKRFFDVAAASAFILLFCWLYILIVLVYILFIRDTVLFKQERIGLNKKIFLLVKFRTLKNSETEIASRKFWFGSFLRATSLDELPQVFQVMTGKMSFIGPRPLPTEYLSLFSAEQNKRHLVKPGITGWAQVNGRNSISWKKKFEFDLYYVQHLSFKFDLIIMAKTILLLLSFKKDVSLKEEKFTAVEK